jgi:hypothetical protein
MVWGERRAGGTIVAPALQQAQQRFRIGPQLLQRVALHSRHHRADQPARLAHLEARMAGRTITRIAIAYGAGRDGF